MANREMNGRSNAAYRVTLHGALHRELYDYFQLLRNYPRRERLSFRDKLKRLAA